MIEVASGGSEHPQASPQPSKASASQRRWQAQVLAETGGMNLAVYAGVGFVGLVLSAHVSAAPPRVEDGQKDDQEACCAPCGLACACCRFLAAHRRLPTRTSLRPLLRREGKCPGPRAGRAPVQRARGRGVRPGGRAPLAVPESTLTMPAWIPRTRGSPDLERLSKGSYTVKWRVTSIDGHVVEGRYAFAVVAAGGPATVRRCWNRDDAAQAAGRRTPRRAPRRRC